MAVKKNNQITRAQQIDNLRRQQIMQQRMEAGLPALPEGYITPQYQPTVSEQRAGQVGSWFLPPALKTLLWSLYGGQSKQKVK
jgi:hypothetical protein